LRACRKSPKIGNFWFICIEGIGEKEKREEMKSITLKDIKGEGWVYEAGLRGRGVLFRRERCGRRESRVCVCGR